MTVRTESVKPRGASSVDALLGRIRGRVGKRGVLVLAALAALIAAAAFNWSWLVAVGMAPLLLALAPCALMCALSLCKGRGESCSSKGAEGAKTS